MTTTINERGEKMHYWNELTYVHNMREYCFFENMDPEGNKEAAAQLIIEFLEEIGFSKLADAYEDVILLNEE